MITLLAANIDYWLTIAPTARRELQSWRDRARSIPDPMLRQQALAKLSGEALNAEAAAFFAVLAPRASRPQLIRLIVAYQTMYDYLDAVNEVPEFSSLHDGLWLHRALLDAVRSPQNSINYYPHHTGRNDGGYLDALIDLCRDALDVLPSRAVVDPELDIAVRRSGAAQAHNHAVTVEGHEKLIHWAEQQAPVNGYLWWELAAGGVSSLATHALLASAASPHLGPHEAQRIAGAYFPAICAISTLLDSLIDLGRDSGTANHSFAARYASSEQAAKRYAAIIVDAEKQIRGLCQARRHKTILIGLVGYYLSAPEANGPWAHDITRNALRAAGPTTQPVLIIMRARRWRHRRSGINPQAESHGSETHYSF